jgi:hypothetical protein
MKDHPYIEITDQFYRHLNLRSNYKKVDWNLATNQTMKTGNGFIKLNGERS